MRFCLTISTWSELNQAYICFFNCPLFAWSDDSEFDNRVYNTLYN